MKYKNKSGGETNIPYMSDSYLENALKHFTKRKSIIIYLVNIGQAEPIDLIKISTIQEALLKEFKYRKLDE